MLNRIATALLSTVVWSLIFSVITYTPISQRQPNTFYDPFGSGLPIYLIFFGLAYVIGGIPCSLLIDKRTRGRIGRLIAYLFAGLVVGILTIMIAIAFLNGPFVGIKTVFAYGAYGSVGACVYYCVLSGLNVLRRTISTGN